MDILLPITTVIMAGTGIAAYETNEPMMWLATCILSAINASLITIDND